MTVLGAICHAQVEDDDPRRLSPGRLPDAALDEVDVVSDRGLKRGRDVPHYKLLQRFTAADPRRHPRLRHSDANQAEGVDESGWWHR